MCKMVRHEVAINTVNQITKQYSYKEFSERIDQVYCHLFSTLGCVTGDGRVLSLGEEQALSIVNGISGVCEDKTKTASLLR